MSTTHIVDGSLYWPDPADFPVSQAVTVTNTVTNECWVFRVILDRTEPAVIPQYPWVVYYPNGRTGRVVALEERKQGLPPDAVMAAYQRWYDMSYTSLAHWTLTGECLQSSHELLNPLPSFQEPLPL